MRAPGFWWDRNSLAAKALQPIGAAYGALTRQRLQKPGRKVDIPIVCIGNPTVGGGGKTPTAIATAALLVQAGARPVFLTRGYGGRHAGPMRVDPAYHRARDVGDEPLLLARAYPTIMSRKRLDGGLHAARVAGADFVVMDDGFQNPSLVKDFSVLVLDAGRGIGNGLVFPAGPLRSPLIPQLRLAHALLVIGDGSAADNVIAAADRVGLPVFRGRLEPSAEMVEELQGKPVLAFAGIADPEKFFGTLRQHGIEPRVTHAFGDHHRFTKAEAEKLLAEAKEKKLTLVTTQKDFVRLDGDGPLAALRKATATLPVRLVFDDPEEFLRLAVEKIKRAD
ncbi:tetraacyldisaccharide 4'-kinase [Variibacter gotjawalensis]|uniref:Tetraacyldisaccharide 4'-kinase n=1 Tax=Variibacter gotjawalensis TaxID=1333996 RepID=A0A0S3PPI6_9BRAD|nr:tetraacyldisaccharide 4'-kinase [Variibacter gotjawalensis]NIK48160.1 tetraacyldisaccharide 4'-kinase [Variibacter gotjawalensis]RZS50032.1 lipid-A-disaccharide kinase [Variibacter gotjawalensis]BAT57863.1 tetraacyldisaccharide 4'-kinase [Variibacter gotjawalensis]